MSEEASPSQLLGVPVSASRAEPEEGWHCSRRRSLDRWLFLQAEVDLEPNDRSTTELIYSEIEHLPLWGNYLSREKHFAQHGQLKSRLHSASVPSTSRF